MSELSRRPGGAPREQDSASPTINPPARRRTIKLPSTDVAQTSSSAAPAPGSKRPRLGGKPRDKRQPTGDYAVGYCKPPVSTRFAKGSPGGPGRRKGDRSQNSIMREELDSKRTVRIEGRERNLSQRELAYKLLLNQAFEKKDAKLLWQITDAARQLFPEPQQEMPADPIGDSHLDELILKNLLASLRLGEPNPDSPDPWSDLGSSQIDLRAGTNHGDWTYDPEDPADSEAEEGSDLDQE